MTDLERVIEAVAKAKRRLEEISRLEDIGHHDANPAYRGARLALNVLLQELHAAAKAEEKADDS